MSKTSVKVEENGGIFMHNTYRETKAKARFNLFVTGCRSRTGESVERMNYGFVESNNLSWNGVGTLFPPEIIYTSQR